MPSRRFHFKTEDTEYTMERLNVNLGDRAYDIIIEKDFSGLGSAADEINAAKKILIVTDTNVAPLYAEEVKDILSQGGREVSVFAFEAGEQNKNMDTVLKICGACVEAGLDRKSMIAALGGGVTGDIAGFAAAIYLRGIPFIQIPTTLLSQSDSSVGGKTGIDFSGGKNLLGAFYQPRLVYMNVSTLKTLPEREIISGMGEVIKHGIIRDAEFFDYLEKNADDVKSLNADTLMKMAKTNCAIKARVVEEDERETGARADLNFGHTIGHAVEAAADFKMTHGACVGLGVIAASRIALDRGMIDEGVFARIKSLYEKYGFETKADIPSDEVIMSVMQKDKKKISGRLKFVLPTAIGTVIRTTDVSDDEIKTAISEIRI